jgi:hypothetical protein
VETTIATHPHTVRNFIFVLVWVGRLLVYPVALPKSCS